MGHKAHGARTLDGTWGLAWYMGSCMVHGALLGHYLMIGCYLAALSPDTVTCMHHAVMHADGGMDACQQLEDRLEAKLAEDSSDDELVELLEDTKKNVQLYIAKKRQKRSRTS